MKTSPIRPAQIDFGTLPRAPQFGDVYHPRIGARAQAEHVFLGGSRLPQRWAGQARFAILETGFGLGNNFLATCAAWCADPDRCRQLVFVSIEAHPPSLDDLRRAHAGGPWPDLAQALIDQWPPAVPNLHSLSFEKGRVQLVLALGEVRTVLPVLRGEFDAFFLDGFSPSCNPAMWDVRVIKALARRAAPGATAATWSVARSLRDDLGSVGFEVRRQPGIGGKRSVLSASFAPRFVPKRALREEARPPPATAVVIGAGLAGAWVAWSLARRGVAVTVIDRHAEPAQETSGNAAGLFHGTLHADDGVHARLHRAAALLVQRVLRPWFAAGEVAGAADGLLRVEVAGLAAMQALIERHGVPPDYAQALSPEAASQRAGVRLTLPAWWFGGGGWVDPRGLVRRLLNEAGVRFVGARAVTRLLRQPPGWGAVDERGGVPASGEVVVLACAASSDTLADAHGLADWPIDNMRGQVSWWPTWHSGPALPIAGDGYAIRLRTADGSPAGLMCGASAQPGDPGGEVREADHTFNRQRLTRLTGLRPATSLRWQGRVGWRLQTADRLPIVGAAAARDAAEGRRSDQVRFVTRVPGLFVSTAFGGRGIALAALAGELLAAQICGTPWPLEADLADAIDPARWLVRSARRTAEAARKA